MRRSKRVVEQVLKKRDTAIIQESTTLAETDSVKDKSLQKEEAYVCSGCNYPDQESNDLLRSHGFNVMYVMVGGTWNVHA